jgi:CheY-like chemotaxis protein
MTVAIRITGTAALRYFPAPVRPWCPIVSPCTSAKPKELRRSVPKNVEIVTPRYRNSLDSKGLAAKIVSIEGCCMAADAERVVLLCDDESLLRQVVRRMLTRHGFEVLEASDGLHALELAETHSGPIHLLLSDVCMPGLDGPSLAKQLQRVRPDIRVLFMTAYCNHSEALDGHPVLHKPFALNNLITTVNEVLTQPLTAVRPNLKALTAT